MCIRDSLHPLLPQTRWPVSSRMRCSAVVAFRHSAVRDPICLVFGLCQTLGPEGCRALQQEGVGV
eukprot:6867402-Alexandrium_andersonii.AAC.1